MGVYGDLEKLNKAPTVSPVVTTQQEDATPLAPLAPSGKLTDERNRDTMQPRNRGVMTPRNHATVIPRNHDTMIETIRAAVKLFGKEAATYRFTVEEKQAIGDMVFAYRGQHIRTSENEITRIGVNFILADYRENGENSILHEVLRALNS